MPPRLPTHGPEGAEAPSWRPFGVRKRVIAAATTALLSASSVLALALGAGADEPAVAPLGARIVTASAGSEVTPLAPLPSGSRAFPGAVVPRFDGHLPARPTPEPPPPAGPDEPVPAPGGSVWDRLADCESGEWDRDGDPVPGTARWDLRPGAHIFEGGLQFHPDTWDAFAPTVLDDAPAAAYQASRTQQIVVAEAVLEAQGWGAWPVCSRKLGLRA